MSSKHHSHGDELEKEFELERLILFSDAVFAIAITLLVIDVKWPELPASLNGVDLFHLFRPTIFGFMGFLLSFFIVGQYWMRHLRLFRLVKGYDQGLISRNLLFLFFIALFPFTAAGLSSRVRPDFMAPVYLYLANFTLLTVMHYAICNYVIRKRPALAVSGEEGEKRFLYRRSLHVALFASFLAVTVPLVSLLVPKHQEYVGFYAVVVLVMRKLMLPKVKKL
jgi:uncharacterized membrane protein